MAVSFATVVSIRPDAVELAGKEPWQWIGQFKDTGFGQAVGMLMPSRAVGALVCFLAVLFSSTSALNATIYSATRVSYALGRDNMLPPMFAAISSSRKTPWVALLFTRCYRDIRCNAAAHETGGLLCQHHVSVSFLFWLISVSSASVITWEMNCSTVFLCRSFLYLPILAIICQGVLVAFMHEMGATALVIAPLWVARRFCFLHALRKA